jgi:hypothetical protein
VVNSCFDVILSAEFAHLKLIEAQKRWDYRRAQLQRLVFANQELQREETPVIGICKEFSSFYAIIMGGLAV